MSSVIKDSLQRKQMKKEFKKCIRMTYMSNSTRQINAAEVMIDEILRKNEYRYFSFFQELLFNDLNIDEKPRFEKALINTFKIKIKQYQEQKKMDDLESSKLYEQNFQNIFFALDHFIRNKQIGFEYKEVVIKFHLDFHVLFGQTLEKYAGQIDYFLKTVDKQVGLLMLQAFIDRKCPDYEKDILYHQSLPIFLKAYSELVRQIIQNNRATEPQLKLEQIFLKTFHYFLDNDFEDRDLCFLSMLNEQNFLLVYVFKYRMFNMFNNKASTQQFFIKILLKFKDIQSIGQNQDYISIVRDQAQFYFQQLASCNFQKEFNQERISLSTQFLCVCVEANIFRKQLNSQQIYEVFMKNIFITFRSYLQQHRNDNRQIYNIFKDASFEMNSECFPVFLNKLFYLLCSGKEWRLQNYFALKKIIMQAMNKWIKNENEWKQAFFALFNVQENVFLNIINLTLILQVKLFSIDSEFLLFLDDKYEIIYSSFKEITLDNWLYFLLVYDTYMDDIWFGKKSENFHFLISHYALEAEQDHVLNKMSSIVVENILSKKFPLKNVAFLVTKCLDLISQKPECKIFPIFAKILEYYCKKQKLQTYLDIMMLILNQFKKDIVSLKCKTSYYAVFRQFLSQELFRDHTTQFQQNIELIYNEAGQNMSFEQIEDIFGKHIKNQKDFSLNVIEQLKKTNIEAQTFEHCQFLSHVVIYQNIKISENKLLKNIVFEILQFSTVQHTILLHNILHNHQNLLQEEIISFIIISTFAKIFERKENLGKFKLTLLILLKNQYERIENIVDSGDFEYSLRNYGEEDLKKKIIERFNKTQTLGSLHRQIYTSFNRLTNQQERAQNNIDIYFLLIYEDFCEYKITYDIPLFLHLQKDILKNHSEKFYQKKYAIFSSMAIFGCTDFITKYFERKTTSDLNRVFNLEQIEDPEGTIRKIGFIIDFENINWLAEVKTILHFYFTKEELKEWFISVADKLFSKEMKELIRKIQQTAIVDSSVRTVRNVKKRIP